MKKHVTVVLLACLPVLAWCQFDKGDWLVGGQISGRYSDLITSDINPQSGNSQFGLGAGVTRILSRNWFLGGSLNWSEEKIWSFPSQFPSPAWARYNYRDIGVVVHTGRYFLLAKNINLVTALHVGYSFGRNRTTRQVNTASEQIEIDNSYNLHFSARPLGLNYTFKQKIVFQLDILTLNFSYRGPRTATPYGGSNRLFTASMNPFTNGFSIYYLIKHKNK